LHAKPAQANSAINTHLPAQAHLTGANTIVRAMEARVARFRQLVPTDDGVAAADVIGEVDVAATA